MAIPPFSFDFNIVEVKSTPDAPQLILQHGNLRKPPTKSKHIQWVSESQWQRWDVNGIKPAPEPIVQPQEQYAVSVFWQCEMQRFLFNRSDCSQRDVLDDEKNHGEEYGWRQLRFDHPHKRHTVLKTDGYYTRLSAGSRGYTPHLLPESYTCHADLSTDCALSGNLGLLIALTGFSAAPNRLLRAIENRLDLAHAQWCDLNHINWGDGRESGS